MLPNYCGDFAPVSEPTREKQKTKHRWDQEGDAESIGIVNDYMRSSDRLPRGAGSLLRAKKDPDWIVRTHLGREASAESKISTHILADLSQLWTSVYGNTSIDCAAERAFKRGWQCWAYKHVSHFRNILEREKETKIQRNNQVIVKMVREEVGCGERRGGEWCCRVV